MEHHPTTSPLDIIDTVHTTETIQTIRNIEKNELIDLLCRYRIPIDQWGTHSAKTVDHLLREINEGETVLVVDNESGTMIREFSFASIEVRYTEGDSVYRLIEHKQVFTDGRERVRQSDISIGEKMKHGEVDIHDVITRALSEELGIQEGYTATLTESVIEEVDSMSYPGLRSHRHRHAGIVSIDAEQYRPEGYVEVQADKTTYFIWQKVV